MNLQENINRIKQVMGLNEIADNIDNIYPFVHYPPRPNDHNPIDYYNFETENEKYVVKFFKSYPSKYFPEGSYGREYMTSDMMTMSGIEPVSDKSMTGENKAIKVNATVMAATIDWLDRHPDFTQLIIEPVDERRLNLVKRFIDNTIGGKYGVSVESMPGLYGKSIIIRNKVMGLNESFEKNLKETDNTYIIEYNEGDIPVGKIRGGVWKNYLTVEHIYLTPEYQSKGYSVQFYKDALELSKQKGMDGLMVGGQLTTAHKTRKTYKHFLHHETEIKNQHGEPYIILTDFIG